MLMNNTKKIMDIMNKIKYGFLDSNGNNIFDDENVEFTFNKKYYLLSPKKLLEKGYGVLKMKLILFI